RRTVTQNATWNKRATVEGAPRSISEPHRAVAQRHQVISDMLSVDHSNDTSGTKPPSLIGDLACLQEPTVNLPAVMPAPTGRRAVACPYALSC
ncbi:MAG TPA: hypothetical protein VMF90_09615, partial [Rhizobiaceae bacterium]|nr:hypothetical protein [Rhizobiaceae bacterium]